MLGKNRKRTWPRLIIIACLVLVLVYRANAAIYEALKASEIDIPFPQREVRMLNQG